MIAPKNPRKPRNKNRVLDIEKDGEYMRVQFVRANGEVVIGDYKLIGWSRAPAAIHNDVIERLRQPVIGMTWSKPR